MILTNLPLIWPCLRDRSFCRSAASLLGIMPETNFRAFRVGGTRCVTAQSMLAFRGERILNTPVPNRFR